MNSKHTPGPWKYDFQSVDREWAIVTNPYGLIVANVNADSRQTANARLIAAAPDLLEALEQIMPSIEDNDSITASQIRHVYADALNAARAAIAKAKGTTV